MSDRTGHQLTGATLEAETRARQFLAEGKWRKARDELKPLVKADRPRHLPLLIQANIGLSREMLGKGQIADAQQVLAYLATIASADQLRAIEAEMIVQTRPAEEAAARILRSLSDSGARLPELERIRLADQAVLAFHPIVTDSEVALPLSRELQAVFDALLAVSQAQWARVQEILRLISRQSVFGHWSIFIKGLAAFYTRDPMKAERFFASLPEGSVPAKASQSFRLLAGRISAAKNGSPFPETVLNGAVELLGFPGVGPRLIRADRSWREGEHFQSYRAVRDGFESFPSLDFRLPGALTDFYFSCVWGMSEDDSDRYLHSFDGILCGRQSKSGTEEMLILRMFALSGGGREDWEAYLGLREKLAGPNPRLASQVYCRIAEGMMEPEQTSALFGRDDALFDDEEGAIECLRKAVDLDPNNLGAHVLLVTIYAAIKNLAERNRLLDLMVKRFPNEKIVLLNAAASCLERKAFIKGLDYLSRARELDRLDPQIPRIFLIALRRHARHCYSQGQVEKARQALERTEEFLTDKPRDVERSRWTSQVRTALLEQLWGDTDRGKTILAKARAVSPFPSAGLFFAHLTNRAYEPRSSEATPFFKGFTAALQAPHKPDELLFLLEMLCYWRSDPDIGSLKSEERRLRQQFKPALFQRFTREEARSLLEMKAAEPSWQSEMVALIKIFLSRDQRDPLFLMYQLLAKGETRRDPDRSRNKLKLLLEEAARRGDDWTVQKIRVVLKELETPKSRFFPHLGPHFEDIFEPKEDSTEGGGAPGDPDPESVLDLLEFLDNDGPPKGGQPLPKGMPKKLLDLLIQAAQEEIEPPTPLPPPRQPKIPASPRPNRGKPEDPAQIDLFQ